MVEEDSKRNNLPLEGISIVAVEQYGAGPWGTMILADLGAEIIKIENPHTKGDIARYVPPHTVNEDSIYFQSFNRNKLGMTLDLTHSRAHEILHPLVLKSDAVFNNLRGDLPKKLGLDYSSLKDVNPAIVCCSLSAFGREGFRAHEPGYDYLMQGYTGWMSITGEPDGSPQKSGLPMVDLSGGAMAAIGLLSALMRSKSTGKGCDVDVNLFDNAISHLSFIAAWHLTKGYQPKRFPDSSHPSMIPSQVLPTKDGWLVVMCAKNKFYQNLVSILGVPELASDDRFADYEDRLKNRDVLIPILKEMSKKKTTSQWLGLLKGNVPCAPVNTVEEAFKDPQTLQDDMVIDVEHPDFGKVRQVAGPIKFSDANKTHVKAPKLGEHTDKILGEKLGFTQSEIDNLRNEKVI